MNVNKINVDAPVFASTMFLKRFHIKILLPQFDQVYNTEVSSDRNDKSNVVNDSELVNQYSEPTLFIEA